MNPPGGSSKRSWGIGRLQAILLLIGMSSLAARSESNQVKGLRLCPVAGSSSLITAKEPTLKDGDFQLCPSQSNRLKESRSQ